MSRQAVVLAPAAQVGFVVREFWDPINSGEMIVESTLRGMTN